MAADWPTVQDVKDFLRLGTDTTDDEIVAGQLAAAIAWTVNRIDPQYDPANPAFVPPLPDPLYTVALMECARLVKRRDSVDGTVGWGDMGVIRVGPKDPDIETLLAAYLPVVFS
jgi:hypothetical protein